VQDPAASHDGARPLNAFWANKQRHIFSVVRYKARTDTMTRIYWK